MLTVVHGQQLHCQWLIFGSENVVRYPVVQKKDIIFKRNKCILYRMIFHLAELKLLYIMSTEFNCAKFSQNLKYNATLQ